MLKTFRFAARLLWRELRTGEWLTILFALFLAITAITGLHFYTDRLTRALDNQSTALLGGDLVISSSATIPNAWKTKAQKLKLHTAEVWSYPSVVVANKQLALVNIQAVSANYPLIGTTPLLIHPHQILVDPRLFTLIHAGLSTHIQIGAAGFMIQASIPNDLNMLTSGWIIAPRILMRLDDIAATKTVIAGSRVDYRLLLVGNGQAIQVFKDWLKPQLHAGQQLLDVNNQRSPLKDILLKANNYIQLVLLICLLMSGIVITLSVRQYLLPHYEHVALWRCLGARENQIIQLFFWQLLMIALVGGLAGVIAGYGLQALIAQVLNNFLQLALPAPPLTPIYLGIMTSIVLLFAYAYPIIIELPKTSPLTLWRSSATPPTRNIYPIITLGILLGFLFISMDFSLLVLLFIDAILLCIGFLYAINILLLKVLQKSLVFTQGAFRRGLSQLIHYPESTTIQLTTFTLLLMTLMMLGTIRTNLIDNWQQSLPLKTPNYFAFNIAPSDLPTIKTFFSNQHIVINAIYPMVRGRLITLDDKPIMSAIPKSSYGNNALHRELNLSWMLDYPSDNKIVRGPAWHNSDQGKALASVEQSLAADLHLRLGDKLGFQIGDQTLAVTISNIRRVNWTSFHPNFFIIFPPGIANNFPTTYITSFYLRADQTNLLNELITQYPNITIIDVARLLMEIQQLLAKIIIAIEYLFFFTVGLGILIFITGLQASRTERNETYQLLHLLGATRKYILTSICVEFICLGTLITILAMILSRGVGYLIWHVIL